MLARSLFSTIGSVVIGRPLNFLPFGVKYTLIALLAGMSLSLRKIWPKSFQRATNICRDSGFSLHFLYSDLFLIFTGNFKFKTFFSCFL